jgi:hypothetical protein
MRAWPDLNFFRVFLILGELFIRRNGKESNENYQNQAARDYPRRDCKDKYK